MFVSGLLILIFIACFASLMNSGLWSNAINLINVVTAGLLAMNYFEPLAALFDREQPSMTYLWDFMAIWLIFIFSMVALRAATDYFSRVKVRFFMPVERVGGLLMAAWVSWVLVCFTTTTLHTAPLARNFLGGAFQPEPDSKMLFGAAPDHRWLAWIHRQSILPLVKISGQNPFDPHGDFILRYAARRQAFEKQLTLSVPSGGSKAP